MIATLLLLTIIGLGGWALTKSPYWNPPTHCDIHGTPLEEYDHELYCVECNKKAWGEI